MKEKITIYQVLPRLYGNTTGKNIPNGTLAENGCGKMAAFTDAELARIRRFGFTHIWYTGLLEHATQTDYTACGIRADHPAVVKGKAGSPYAVKDYYDIDPDLATDVPSRMKRQACPHQGPGRRRQHGAGFLAREQFLLHYGAAAAHRLRHGAFGPVALQGIPGQSHRQRPLRRLAAAERLV